MSLAEKADEGPPRIVEDQPRVVVLDVERVPGVFTADFWDMNAYKNRRLDPDTVTEWPRTICAAWQWYHADRIEFSAEWHKDGREGFLSTVWDVFDQAEVVVGHAMQRFDVKALNTEWRDAGYRPPSTYKVVDTLAEARKHFLDESAKLDALCKRLGLDAKTDTYSVATARAAVAGDKAAQSKLRAYNRGDITASLALYDALRGWIPSHPHVGQLDEETRRCNQCGSDDLEANGTYLAVQIRYKRYRCRHCGANLRGVQHSRAANIRGIK